MDYLFWKGETALPLKLTMNTGALLALITGNTRDSLMKKRMQNGYDARYSDYAKLYDSCGG